MGEKGNAVADLTAGVAGGSVVERVSTTVTEVVTGTATQAGEKLRDKAIEQGASHTVDEVRERLRDRREAAAAAEAAAGDDDGDDLPPPGLSPPTA